MFHSIDSRKQVQPRRRRGRWGRGRRRKREEQIFKDVPSATSAVMFTVLLVKWVVAFYSLNPAGAMAGFLPPFFLQDAFCLENVYCSSLTQKAKHLRGFGPLTCTDLGLDNVVFFCSNNVTLALTYWMFLICHRCWSKLYLHYGLCPLMFASSITTWSENYLLW